MTTETFFEPFSSKERSGVIENPRQYFTVLSRLFLFFFAFLCGKVNFYATHANIHFYQILVLKINTKVSFKLSLQRKKEKKRPFKSRSSCTLTITELGPLPKRVFFITFRQSTYCQRFQKFWLRTVYLVTSPVHRALKGLKVRLK